MKKFELGQVVMTNGINNVITNGGNVADADKVFNLLECIDRHKTGDWGNLCEENKQLNDSAVVDGGRILSAYEIGENKVKIWIITEADRSYTTILLPEEY